MMSKSYHYVPAMQQPDRTSCWSTTMSWWTKAIPAVKNHSEIEILGMYHHLTGDDGGLKFPDGFKTMLEDPKWGMTTDRISAIPMNRELCEKAFKKGPIVCGYWDINVNGYHAIALYNYKDFEIWAMDPNGGSHVKRGMDYYVLGSLKHKGIFGYRT